MSAQRYVKIYCDVCELDYNWSFDTTTEARKVLHDSVGWHFGQGRDICPECWEVGER